MTKIRALQYKKHDDAKDQQLQSPNYFKKLTIILSQNLRFSAMVFVLLFLVGTLLLLPRLEDAPYMNGEGPGQQRISKGVETDIFIGVSVSSEKGELAKSIAETWAGVLKEQVTVGLFACTNFTDSLPFIIQDISYPCNESSSVESWRAALQIMSQLDRVKWFFMCDGDAYVNMRALVGFLHDIARRGVRHEDPFYFGNTGRGVPSEQHLLGLNNGSYVIGGPCAGLSSGAMKALRPILADCMRWPAARQYPDTQLGRCLLALNIIPRLPHHSDSSLRRLFRHFSGNVPATLTAEELALPPVTIHSVRDPLAMRSLHAQLHRNE